ncbi:zinc-dependent alcohol dehydrogenase [Virgisporangium aurantiacum]|uniref:Galactitol-1-phosphate 5-dehydrogenase n=1 Tax=Virgisporangium aurantiacum TaxID=175570 RepID=A0A8J3Z8X4_9ACTN|nr:alcohol dehydrogenase catalytic domain-containing protein [Virgisporangium aurantiacum]GIJ57435.1 galactitol-1-phosphate 5-dehydrogenase [Virgisporangium aurantiacum]
MRALVFRGPSDLVVADRPDPVPDAGEVLLRIVATGICGSDLHGYTGENGRRHPGQVMGHETVARTADTGRLVTVNPVMGCGDCPACAAGTEQLCARRRVIGVDPSVSSAFAELMVAPAANVVPLPDDLPEEYGALVEPLAVGHHAALRGQVGAGDRVLVVGGGPIGQAAALAARRAGATAIAVSEPSASRRALVDRLGFAAVEPGALADLDPVTVVLDAVGSTASLRDGLAASTLGARIVLVGMNAPQVSLSAYEISTQERSIVGSFCYTSREFADTAAWVASRPPGLESLVDDQVPFDEAPRAFARLASGELDASKVLVRCQP